MKLKSITITDLRGLRSDTFSLDESNSLISGPNGTGKSGLIDAIDFLITGSISRLTGSGSGGLSVKLHGKHVDASLDNSRVEAVITLPDGSSARVSRSLKDSDELVVEEGDAATVNTCFDRARSRRFLLSRKELLAFVTAPPKDRAQQVQELLNLQEIANVRSELKSTANHFTTKVKQLKKDVSVRENELCSRIGVAKFDEATLLLKVNEYRKELSLEPVASLTPKTVVSGLSQKKISTEVTVNWVSLESQIASARKCLEDPIVNRRRTTLSHAKEISRKVSANPQLAELTKVIEFLKGGLDLQWSSSCPFCNLEWDESELRRLVRERLSEFSEESGEFTSVIESLGQVSQDSNILLESVSKIAQVTERLNDGELAPRFRAWEKKLTAFKDVVSRPTKLFTEHVWPAEVDDSNFNINECLDLLAQIEGRRPAKEDKTTETRDVLVELGVLVDQYINSKTMYSDALVQEKKATELYESYIEARNSILQSIYDAVRDRFVAFYRQLHGEDEASFSASLEPTEAGLELTVDFYGRGTHPPHALHSEGHQDSMGLCLFLALAERLNKGVVEVIVLDDVVMSVDSTHRQEVCKLIAGEFSDFQIIITTHEEVWAQQLRRAGVVGRKTHWRFVGWSVASGPRYIAVQDFWNIAKQEIESGELSKSAHTIRYGLEAFFEQACNGLGGSVTYRSTHDWGFGELKDGARSKLGKVLNKAIEAEKSWGNVDKADDAQSLKNRLEAIGAKFDQEQWIINPQVHFNNWANFSANEAKSVVENVAEYCAVFCCSNCGGQVYILRDGPTEQSLRCPCGGINLNLLKKG